MRQQMMIALAALAIASTAALSGDAPFAAPCELECSLSGDPQVLLGGTYHLTGTATNNCPEPLWLDEAILHIDGPGQRQRNVLWWPPGIVQPGQTRSLHVTKQVSPRAPLGEYTVSLTAMRAGEQVASDTMMVEVVPVPVPAMVLVPSGTFIMGDGVAWCGVDERQVTLTRDFWLGQYEVTNQEYLDLLRWAYDRGYVTADSSSVRDNLDGSTEELVDLDDEHCELVFSNGIFSLREVDYALRAYPEGYDPADHPMKEVTWYGAASYCDWLSLSESLGRAYDHSTWLCGGGDPYTAEGYRLPTEAEWEYAAQWNDERIYPWGNRLPQKCLHANYHECIGWTSPVGSFPAGVQPNLSKPIYDLTGNLWEWANDWFECSLGTDPVIDPIGPMSGTGKPMRGGDWNVDVTWLRLSERYGPSPPGSDSILGFRVARSAP